MIPVKLSLSGFLSYRDPIELDFSTFNLACISGPNGAGKSSLLDAMTWALFGRARKRDDSLINSNAKAAEVVFIFEYEGNLYRVQRTAPRDKTTLLEFHILSPSEPVESSTQEGVWRPLTERTMRETQALIENTLRLDYDTFINASFFLQGKADQFTQQSPGERKRILGSILGLEIWETYRQQAVELRRSLENRIHLLEGQLHEVNQELDEEAVRVAKWKSLQHDLEQITRMRQAQVEILENIRKVVAMLAEQERKVEALSRQMEMAERRLAEQQAKLSERYREKETFTDLLARSDEIQAAYASWQQARAELERMEQVAVHFREHEKYRQEPLDEINRMRARLEQEEQTLRQHKTVTDNQRLEIPKLNEKLAALQVTIQELERVISSRPSIETELSELSQRLTTAAVEKERLKKEMSELKVHIDELESLTAARCPFCQQPLSPQDRQRLVENLKAQGTELGGLFRTHKTFLEKADQNKLELEDQLRGVVLAEAELRDQSRSYEQLRAQHQQLMDAVNKWDQEGALRLGEIEKSLADETFCPEARSRLDKIDADLKAIGYDVAAHDAARQTEINLRQSETDLRELERAQATAVSLDREIAELESQCQLLKEEQEQQRKEYEEAGASLAEAQARAPDLSTAENRLLEIEEQANQLRIEVGRAQQQVDVLKELKHRKKEFIAERDSLKEKVGQYKDLERAFGRDGVPALLIEQALPQIEEKANQILYRLSDGVMSVRFETQAEYKDKHREDRRETLEIKISDSIGTRDYEMFSGGEAFRVNFAIRLALSEVLAQRAGARLQMLVIDEGFGSQDTLGRQRLVETINLVQRDFAKILVITHIDELKDAFPTRIEVAKTAGRSSFQVVQ